MAIKNIAVPVKRKGGKTAPLDTAPASYRPATADSLQDRRPPMLRAVHRYRVGQRLSMSQGGRDISRLASICVVTALLPHEAGPLLYRVRSEREGFERVVDEIDLATLTAGLE